MTQEQREKLIHESRMQAFMEAQDICPIARDLPPNSSAQVWIDAWSDRLQHLQKKEWSALFHVENERERYMEQLAAFRREWLPKYVMHAMASASPNLTIVIKLAEDYVKKTFEALNGLPPDSPDVA